jgi:hypothetical protein
MAVPPGSEQLHDALAMRVTPFHDFDALNRVAAAEGQQRISHPFAPRFEAAERPTTH